MKTVRVFIVSKGGQEPPVKAVKEFFKADRVYSIAPIGDGVFTAVIRISDDE